MKKMEYMVNTIVRKLLVMLVIFCVCNELWIDKNTIYYITEVSKWTCLIGIVILEMIKIEYHDYLLQKEWSFN